MTNPLAELPDISRDIWDLKYRLRSFEGTPVDQSVSQTFDRVACAAASVEKGGPKAREKWSKRFRSIIADLGFLPAGRILAGAGADRGVTLMNCFVMGPVKDDLSGIFDSVKRAARTMQSGGGIGVDFSSLRPQGARVASLGVEASGPVSFMGVWDAMCETILSAGSRRGAMMATLRADHPDIERFIEAKSEAGKLTNFNLSVLVSDAFMDAIKNDEPWDLVFDGVVYRTVKARSLWQSLMRATYAFSEPGVIFIDRVNAQNNLSYCETIHATNPCGEQPLPSFGACLLGSVNLATLVEKPFTKSASIDREKLEQRVSIAVRFLDNLIDVSHYPINRQRKEAREKRRIGLGVTGLANALIMCGEIYGSKDARSRAANWMKAIQNAAYRASARLAKEKGTFPLYDATQIQKAPGIARLENSVRADIERWGLRNGCLTSIAPAGTISLLAGNTSSGIEPVFEFECERIIIRRDANRQSVRLRDYAFSQFQKLSQPNTPLPDEFVTASQLAPSDHIKMQAALQPYVDSAISKTINCPEDLSFEEFKNVYRLSYEAGLKGCTTYRPSPMRGAVLKPAKLAQAALQSSSDEEAATAPPPDAARHGQDVQSSAQAIGQDDGASQTVVYMSQPLKRAPELSGVTYKLKWPQSNNAIYVTINDIETDGRRRPFEIFINTRNLEHYSWTVALTRMISAVFRRGGDVTFVATELKEIFDPQGGAWMDGHYVPSLLAAIGEIIEKHLQQIGFMPALPHTDPQEGTVRATATSAANAQAGAPNPGNGHSHGHQPQFQTGSPCPRCGSRQLERRESCWLCPACGYSSCD